MPSLRSVTGVCRIAVMHGGQASVDDLSVVVLRKRQRHSHLRIRFLHSL